MSSVSLADIRAAADAKYGPFIITGIDGGDVVFLNAIRLSKDARAAVTAKQAELNAAGADTDTDALIRELLTLLAEHAPDVDRLYTALGDDQALILQVLQDYAGSSQLGEVSSSAS